MSGNPVSIQHQGYARLLSENTLQGTGTHRTSGRQAQTFQAYRTSMREDGAELRLVCRAWSRLPLYTIRPPGPARAPRAKALLRASPPLPPLKPWVFTGV